VPSAPRRAFVVQRNLFDIDAGLFGVLVVHLLYRSSLDTLVSEAMVRAVNMVHELHDEGLVRRELANLRIGSDSRSNLTDGECPKFHFAGTAVRRVYTVRCSICLVLALDGLWQQRRLSRDQWFLEAGSMRGIRLVACAHKFDRESGCLRLC